MWPFSKKQTLAESGFFKGFTDWHCHILPGVDDGVQTMDEALAILAEYERLGIKEVWLTPHIMEDIPNTTAHLRKRFAELQAAYTGSIALHLAAENMLDPLFEQRLAAGDLLPLEPEGNRLLVETSYFNPPIDLYGMLERIKSAGYHPVLAHPERYLYMSPADYRKLKASGIEFQLNLPSLYGLYGGTIQKKAKWITITNLHSYIGMDLHSENQLNKMLDLKYKIIKSIQ